MPGAEKRIVERLQPLEARRIGFAADRHQQPDEEPEANLLGFDAKTRTAGDLATSPTVDDDRASMKRSVEGVDRIGGRGEARRRRASSAGTEPGRRELTA